MDERLERIQERYQSACELADSGGPGLSEAAQDIGFLLSVIEEAPHDAYCWTKRGHGDECDCWKSWAD